MIGIYDLKLINKNSALFKEDYDKFKKVNSLKIFRIISIDQ